MLSPASSCLSVCLSVGWMDDLLLWSSGSCADTLLGRQLTENNNNNKLAPAEMLCVCVKAAQTICANAPVLSTGWSFAFLLRLYSASPPLLVPHSLSLSFSLSLTHTHTHARTLRHVHAQRGYRPIRAARQQGYIVWIFQHRPHCLRARRGAIVLWHCGCARLQVVLWMHVW